MNISPDDIVDLLLEGEEVAGGINRVVDRREVLNTNVNALKHSSQGMTSKLPELLVPK